MVNDAGLPEPELVRVAAVLSLVGLLATGSAACADPDQYLCIPDHEIGFTYSEQAQAWQPI